MSGTEGNSVAREFFGILGIVFLVGAVLFAVAGVWPPVVAVESASMQPNLDRGDLVFVTGVAPDGARPLWSMLARTVADAAAGGAAESGGERREASPQKRRPEVGVGSLVDECVAHLAAAARGAAVFESPHPVRRAGRVARMP